MFRIIILIGVLSVTNVAFGDSWYKLTAHKVLATWREAQLRCSREGGLLASPFNGAVLKDMKSLMAADKTYYIGTRAGDTPATYLSLEGIPIENMTEAMDKMVQELDPLDGDCMAINQQSIRLVPCWTRLQYFCYARNTTTTNHSWCNNGYRYDPTSQKCYKVHRNSLTWDEAKSTCIAEGGQLAVVKNKKDVEVILKMFAFGDMSIFIGLRDRTGYDDWESVDGRPVEDLYNDWKKDSYEKCDYLCGALFRTGELDNLNCAFKRDFICEVEAPA